MYRLRFASFPLRVGFFSGLENNFLITEETEKKDKKKRRKKKRRRRENDRRLPKRWKKSVEMDNG